MNLPANQPLLHAVGNAHIDPVWLWRWPEGLETIRATFRSVLDRMNEYPKFVFTGSSAAFYAWLKETDPAMFSEVAARVREGRWEIVGGWWIQPDANIPGGESFVRQALYGQRFFQDEFGRMATIGYNPDTFGHSGTLPQILRKSGISRYVFMRPMEHEKSLAGNVFHWRALDGSEVLTARIAHSYGSWGDELNDHIDASDKGRPMYLNDYIVFYGVGNHGGGPTRRNLDSIQALGKTKTGSNVTFSTLDTFFSAVEQQIAEGANVPVVAEDLQHHARGCYTAESEVKRQNRRLEHLLMTAERFATVAHLVLGRDYPREQLTSAWKAVLFNQFHDILAGSSLPEAYQDARDGYGYAAQVANQILHTSLQAISGHIDTRGKGDALVIYNPLPWTVKTPVEVERGSSSISHVDGIPVDAQSIQPTTVVGQQRSCFVAEIPALGYRVFRQDATAAESDNPLFRPVAQLDQTKVIPRQLAITATSMENQFWRIEVDPQSGAMTQLFDKRNRVEVLKSAANIGIVIDDPSDTWSHNVVSYRTELGRLGDAKVSIEENGPVRIVLHIETHWGHSTAVQQLILYRDIELIECRLTINWQERMKMLKLSFPLQIKNPRATYDTAYGSIERKCNGEEEPGQQWVDVSGEASTAGGETIAYGFSLLNDSKYGFDVLDSDLRMSVLRSPIYAYHDPYKPEPNRAYVYQDQGIQTITYRLAPHAGAWQTADVSRRAWELNVRPLWVNEYIHAGDLPVDAAFVTVEPANIVLSVCKIAEDSDTLIVRGYESAGTATHAMLSLPMMAVRHEVMFRAHEIKTLCIDVKNGVITEVDLLERPV